MKTLKILYNLILLLYVVLLAGCSSGKNVSRETIDLKLPHHYKATNTAMETVLAGKWWERFTINELNGLFVQVFNQNLTLKQTVARLKQARASEKLSRSERFPSLNIGGNVNREKQFTTFGNTLGTTSRWSASTNYELDFWGKIKDRHAAATLIKKAAREDVKTAYMLLAAQIAELYFFIVEQQNQLELFNEIIKTLKDSLKRVEDRYINGLSGSIDVYQARENILLAETNIPIINSNIQTAQNELAVLLGGFPEEPFQVSIIEVPIELPEIQLLVPPAFLQNRPDITAAFLRLQAQDAKIAAAVKDRLPTIDFFASIGESTLRYGGPSLTGDFWSLLLDITLPLFDGGRRRAEVDLRKAEREESLYQYYEVVLNSVKEIENALINIRQTREKVQILEDRVVVSASSLRLSEDNYYAGLTDYIPVLIAQRSHFETKSQLITARKDLINHIISFAQATGGQWLEVEAQKIDKQVSNES